MVCLQHCPIGRNEIIRFYEIALLAESSVLVVVELFVKRSSAWGLPTVYITVAIFGSFILPCGP